MYSVLGHGMGHGESRRRLMASAVEIVRISDSFADGEYEFLDAILFVSI